AAVRELLGRLGDRAPVVLFIDDAHWADADSAALVFELLRPPEPAALLLVVADRSGGEAGSDLLRVLAVERPEGAAHRTITIDLAPLPADDAEALARALLGGDAAREHVSAIARDSGGSPLFMTELVRAASRAGPAAEVSLQTLLAARIGALDV